MNLKELARITKEFGNKRHKKKSKLKQLRLGKLILSIGWYSNNENDIIRKEAKDWLFKKSLNNKECEFTGMTLHYKGLPHKKGTNKWGSMIIRLNND